jgi:hypothetical protein
MDQPRFLAAVPALAVSDERRAVPSWPTRSVSWS